MTVHIDLTTRNTVFNPISAQGSWIQHRFGRRNYPKVELDIKLVTDLLNQTTDTVFLTSSFGDPLCYTHIEEILKLKNNFIIHSYINIKNDALFNRLADSNNIVVVKLSGIKNLVDKIYLNSDWDTIYNNLSILKDRALIEFELFEHNEHQLPELLKICDQFNSKIKIAAGTSLNGINQKETIRGFSSIIDQGGNWLYDVNSINHNFPNDFVLASELLNLDFKKAKEKPLYQTVKGYAILRTFVKKELGKSILNRPSIFKTSSEKSPRPINGYSVAVTGHVFPNENITKFFSNMLCTDWKLSPKDIFYVDRTNNYLLDIAKLVGQINSLDLSKIHYSNNLRGILSYLSNSNI